MNPGRYFMPNMVMNPMIAGNSYGLSRGIGSFGKIINGIKNFDWSKLLTGANKTLNVMNQTIPLIRQAKPMINNAKSMFKIVRALGSEMKTGNTRSMPKSYSLVRDNSITKEEANKNDNYPNFFI